MWRGYELQSETQTAATVMYGILRAQWFQNRGFSDAPVPISSGQAARIIPDRRAGSPDTTKGLSLYSGWAAF